MNNLLFAKEFFEMIDE